MDFVEKVSETVTSMTSKGKKAINKAKEMAEIAALKNQIAACEEVVRKNYMEIGRMVVAQYKKEQGSGGSEESTLYEKQCKAVLNAQAGVKDLQRKIKEVKGGK